MQAACAMVSRGTKLPAVSCKPCRAAILLLTLCLVHGAGGVVVEHYNSGNPLDGATDMSVPGLWVQQGIQKEGGRGTLYGTSCSYLDVNTPIQESEVLARDNSTDPIDFYYKFSSCSFNGDFRLRCQVTNNAGRNWTTVWGKSGTEMVNDAWTLVSVAAPPLSEGSTLAVRFVFTGVPYDLCSLTLDDISIPASFPTAAAAPSPTQPTPAPTPSISTSPTPGASAVPRSSPSSPAPAAGSPPVSRSIDASQLTPSTGDTASSSSPGSAGAGSGSQTGVTGTVPIAAIVVPIVVALAIAILVFAFRSKIRQLSITMCKGGV